MEHNKLLMSVHPQSKNVVCPPLNNRPGCDLAAAKISSQSKYTYFVRWLASTVIVTSQQTLGCSELEPGPYAKAF